MLLLFLRSFLYSLDSPVEIICFSVPAREARKSMPDFRHICGDRNAYGKGTMQLTIRTKVTYGFLILAFGLMLTDVCRLMRAPSEAPLSAASSAPHLHRF